MALVDPKDLWPELDAQGEAEVRRKLVLNAYGHSKLPAVQEWLRVKELERQELAQRHDQGLRKDELHVLRSTKNAAWIAAIAALLSMIFAAIVIWRSWAK